MDPFPTQPATQPPRVEFGVSVPAYGMVRVRWTRPLGRPMAAVYQALLEVLEELDGVESVTMGRYTADVYVADHVVSDRRLCSVVAEALRDALTDGELRRAFRMEFQNPVWDVQCLLPEPGGDL